MTQIETARLVLRPMSMDDVDLLLDLDSDPAVMRYLSQGWPPSREEMLTKIPKRLGHRWMAFERATGQFVGWFALDPEGEGEYEVGYRMRQEMWGRGLGSEGAMAMLAMAFDDLGAHRVFAQTMTVNQRSRRVMEKCGLRFVRTFHLDWEDPLPGAEHGEVEYAILRAEWQPQT